jgi:hypothetical protein
MKADKFDPALAVALQRLQTPATRFEVTVRVAAPLLAPQLSQLASLGVQADARRTIFTAELDRESLGSLSEAACVVRISLAQSLRPLSSRPS